MPVSILSPIKGRRVFAWVFSNLFRLDYSPQVYFITYSTYVVFPPLFQRGVRVNFGLDTASWVSGAQGTIDDFILLDNHTYRYWQSLPTYFNCLKYVPTTFIPYQRNICFLKKNSFCELGGYLGKQVYFLIAD